MRSTVTLVWIAICTVRSRSTQPRKLSSFLPAPNWMPDVFQFLHEPEIENCKEFDINLAHRDWQELKQEKYVPIVPCKDKEFIFHFKQFLGGGANGLIWEVDVHR